MNRNVTILSVLCLSLCLWIVTHPGEVKENVVVLPPPVLEAPRDLPELTAEQSKLFNTLVPHFEGVANRIHDKREEKLARELYDFSFADYVTGKMSAEKLRFVSLIVAALAAFVLAALKAALYALILTLLWKYILAHWVYVAGAWVLGVIIPAAITAKVVK